LRCNKTITNAGGHAGGTAWFSGARARSEPSAFPTDAALAWVRDNGFGQNLTAPGPFGPHPRRHFDYTASGLPFRPTEDLLQKRVLPFMSNTHSESSYAAEIINAQVEAAHTKVRRTMRGTEDDDDVFTGSGPTGAVNILIGCVGIRAPAILQECFDWTEHIPPEARPTVVLSRMEHHSNDLPLTR
jgi:selenocysteine lyase/cysteine desulfurase